MIGVRPAVPGDAAEIGAVHFTAWQETYAALFPEMCAELTPERCAEIFRRRGCRDVFVSEKDGKIVGFCAFSVSGEEGEIAGLYVLRSEQGKGCGKVLAEAAEAAMKAKGALRIRLWVAEGNERAIGFYRHRGFVFSSRKKSGRIPEAEMVSELQEKTKQE